MSYHFTNVKILDPKSRMLLPWNSCGIVIKSVKLRKNTKLAYTINDPINVVYLKNFIFRECLLNQTLNANTRKPDMKGLMKIINSCIVFSSLISNKNR